MDQRLILRGLESYSYTLLEDVNAMSAPLCAHLRRTQRSSNSGTSSASGGKSRRNCLRPSFPRVVRPIHIVRIDTMKTSGSRNAGNSLPGGNPPLRNKSLLGPNPRPDACLADRAASRAASVRAHAAVAALQTLRPISTMVFSNQIPRRLIFLDVPMFGSLEECIH